MFTTELPPLVVAPLLCPTCRLTCPHVLPPLLTPTTCPTDCPNHLDPQNSRSRLPPSTEWVIACCLWLYECVDENDDANSVGRRANFSEWGFKQQHALERVLLFLTGSTIQHAAVTNAVETRVEVRVQGFIAIVEVALLLPGGLLERVSIPLDEVHLACIDGVLIVQNALDFILLLAIDRWGIQVVAAGSIALCARIWNEMDDRARALQLGCVDVPAHMHTTQHNTPSDERQTSERDAQPCTPVLSAHQHRLTWPSRQTLRLHQRRRCSGTMMECG